MKGGILNYLIAKKTFTLSLTFVLVLLVSILTYIKIPLEIMPKESAPPFLYLTVKSTNNLDPVKQEFFLTMPIESALRTLPNILELNAKTKKNGSNFSITFRPKTNIELSFIQLQEILQELDSKGVLQYKNTSISKFNPESEPIMRISVSGLSNIPKGEMQLIKEIKPRLEALQGITKVELSGLNKVTYEFNINTDEINQHGLNPNSISKSLNFENKRASLGALPMVSERIMTGIKGRVVTEDFSKIGSSVIKSGTSVTVEKIAKVKKVENKDKFINHKNGSTAIFMELYNSEDANLFEVKKKVDEFFDNLKNENSDLSKLNFQYIVNKSQDLQNAIDGVFESLYTAILITFFVVFLFLRKIKVTLVICMVIPVTILITIGILFTRGESLNILSLSGLILSIGLIVDNAIVVTERILQLKVYKKGKDAAVTGAKDVAVALFMSTMTTVIIFLPAAFIDSGDSFTDMLKSFQAPVIAALGSSYLVALLFVPLGTLLVKNHRPKDENDNTDKFRPLFRWIYNRKKIITVSLLFILYWIGGTIADIEQTDIDLPRDPFVSLNITFSPETGLDFRKSEFLKLEKHFLSKKKELGFKFLVTSYSTGFTSGNAVFYPKDQKKSDDEIEKLKSKIMNSVDGYKFPPGVYIRSGYGGVGTGQVRTKKQLKIAGAKSSVIEKTLLSLKDELEGLDGVDEVKTTRELKGRRNFLFIPTPEVLNQYSLSLSKLSKIIRSRSHQVSIKGLKLNGEDVGAKINLGNNKSLNPKDFMNMKIKTAEGRFVSLNELGEMRESFILSSINRRKGLAEGRLSVFFKEGLGRDQLNQSMKLSQYVIDDFDLPKGYGKPIDDMAERVRKMKLKGNFVILLSIFLIYLLIASLFESFFVPFAILFTVPLALIFGVAGLFFLEMPLDPMARLGLIILIGIVVNNAIILIDVITKLKREGYKRKEAIILGCSSRFKTVVMTAVTTILGIAPVAFGNAKIMGIPYSSLGVCIISGMLFSTIITLVLLPVIYEIFDNAENKIKEVLGLS
ncbi:efflux RND transporter permease subunit [Bacteriovoracaceae bacterium]|nr:efflux RND transporter permease subunit [Bacteriovoracaceae bacterium]